MEAFISNHQFNTITRIMRNYQHTLKFNGDPMIVAAAKGIANDEIKGIFSPIEDQYKSDIDIDFVDKAEDVDRYLKGLEGLTYGMKGVTESQIRKLFKKEKKLKLPSTLDSEKKSYFGWVDQGKKKLYIVYWLNNKLLGMVCNMGKVERSNSHMCSLCGHMDESNDVVPISVRCKTASQDNYHVIGFNVCKDSGQCNGQITSLESLEKLIKKVNGIG